MNLLQLDSGSNFGTFFYFFIFWLLKSGYQPERMSLTVHMEKYHSTAEKIDYSFYFVSFK